MELGTIMQQADALIYLERYVDEGARTYSRYSQRSETAPPYKPSGKQSSFKLITARIPVDEVQIVEAAPDSRLHNFYICDGEVRFALHPETWAAENIPFLDELRKYPQGDAIEVSPTASTRTVLVRNADNLPPHFLKLHYPKYVSRFNRRLRRLNICNSVAVTRDIKNICHPRFAYLPDELGFIFGTGSDAWGFLVREAHPHPLLQGGSLIPGFALYGGDLMHPDHPPLLVQMIARAKAEPASFVLDNIMIPVVECWAKAASECGFLLESHGQNTLIEVGDDLMPRRIVHRDFDVWIDFETRKRLGLENSFLGEGIFQYPAEQYYSLVYDHFVGREFFDYLLKTLKRFYKVDERSVRENVKRAFLKAFPDNERLFPSETTYYFSDAENGKKFAFIDTGKPPEWR